MKFKIRKDKHIRKKFYQVEQNKLINKFVFVNLLNNPKVKIRIKRKLAKFLLKNMDSRISKTKIVRRCVITGRSRVSSRLLGISRIYLRDMLRNEIIPGFSKAIW